VILVATGGEALFADIGHLGKEPIRNAWIVVFIALIINYFGQGAYLITHPGTKTVLFEMVSGLFPVLYLPFLVLTIVATVIASQAIIAGIFSIIYQSINIKLLLWLVVRFTSPERKTQIYIGTANWFLLISVIFILWIFQTSDSLANAYGLAVTGSMTITGIFITLIYFKKRRFLVGIVALLVAVIDAIFLVSTGMKIPTVHTGR
jgi:KUP system potassium uptake protein